MQKVTILLAVFVDYKAIVAQVSFSNPPANLDKIKELSKNINSKYQRKTCALLPFFTQYFFSHSRYSTIRQVFIKQSSYFEQICVFLGFAGFLKMTFYN